MTDTAVTVPPATVISTCTGPYFVEAAAPVTVVAVDDEDEDEDEEALVVPAAALVPLAVEPVLVETGATTEDSALAAAVDDVDVW
jgi:hypothetical protein